MHIRWIGAVALVVSAAACGQDSMCGNQPLLTTTRSDGSKIALYVSDEQLKDGPKWSPRSGEPPLSLSKAIALAETWAKTQYKRFDEMRTHSIELSEFACIDRKGQWYYKVYFTPVVDGDVLYGAHYFVAVLMNGTVVAPTSERP